VNFVLSDSKWGEGETGRSGGIVEWSFAQTPGTGFVFDDVISDTRFQNLIREAFQAWEDVANIDFQEVTDSSDISLRLGWDTIDGPSGTVGEASFTSSKTTSTLFSIQTSEIRFDSAENWATDRTPTRSEMSLYATAVHEIGHVIGLEHVDDPNTIMYFLDTGDVLDLTAGDIQGAQTIYGASTSPKDGTGTEFADVITGNQLIDDIKAGAGDDTITGAGDNDLIDGGAGMDTAVLSGDQSSYTVLFSQAGTAITDRRPSQDGTDVLIDIENLQFADGAFDIGIRSGAVGLSAEDFAAITELYIAYFDRAPAAKGLLYWATRLDDGMTLPEIAESFFVQPETQRTYETFLNNDGSLNDTTAFVKAVFNNVLGRDPSGPYWVNELDTNPEITPAIFILAVLNGAMAVTGGAADAAYLEAKTDVGVYFSAIKGLSDYDDTVAVMNIFDGSAASITNAVAEIDRLYVEALDPDTGEFLMPLVGVIDDPFAVA
jgi:hypothetical protein